MGLQCSADGLDVDAITAMNSGSAFRQDGSQEDVAKMQMDLVGLAFSCNATRVATLQVGMARGTRYTRDGRRWSDSTNHHRVQSDGQRRSHPEGRRMAYRHDRSRMETFSPFGQVATYATCPGPLRDKALHVSNHNRGWGPPTSYHNLPDSIAGSKAAS